MFAKGSKPGVSVTSAIWLEGFLDSVNMDHFWSFDGSLTTPPCTEGIRWTVLKEVQPISDAQLQKFTQLWADNTAFAAGKGNNREVQPLNDRTLYSAGGPAPKGRNAALITTSVLLGVSTVTLIVVSVVCGIFLIGLVTIGVLLLKKPEALGYVKASKTTAM